MYKKQHERRLPDTEFEQQWGIHIDDLARVEDVTTDAIRMRVMKWGTPFQRRGKPSKYEKKYGKTQAQLAMELGVHPISIASREQTHGNVYHFTEVTRTRWNLGQTTNSKKVHWSETGSWQFTLKSTYFTLEEALDKLKQLQAQDEANKDMGNGV